MDKEMNPRVVILAGGQGTRLREETEFKPKPMVTIGGIPILVHIMKIYSEFGFKRFVICLGYKGEVIKEYFLNFKWFSNDFEIKVRDQSIKVIGNGPSDDWEIILADTGDGANTGSRIKQVEKHIDTDYFLATYGDSVANIDLGKLVRFHREHGKLGTLTGVHPHSRFGVLKYDSNNRITEFSEKPMLMDLVNGGFYVFDKKFFDYLAEDHSCVLEKEPLSRLARDKQLMIHKHGDFWHAMDTYKDFLDLNALWNEKKCPWITNRK